MQREDQQIVLYMHLVVRLLYSAVSGESLLPFPLKTNVVTVSAIRQRYFFVIL